MAAGAEHVEVLRAAGSRRHLHSRSARRRGRVVHELLAGILRRRPGARRNPGINGHLRLRHAGTPRSELHPDNGGVGRGNERHGGRDPGDDVDGNAAATDVAADPLHDVHRDVRRRRRNALHADPRRPPAAHVSLRTRGRQYPARTDRSRAAEAIGFAPLRRDGARRRRRHRRRHCRRRPSAPG